MPKNDYNVRIPLRGLGAYVVDRLLEEGMHGITKEGVVERIVTEWMITNMRSLEAFGITVQDARDKKYIPYIPRRRKST